MNYWSWWILGVCSWAWLGYSAGTDPTAFVPQEIQAVARVDWQAMRQSPMLSSYIEEHPQRYELVTGRLTQQVGIELDQVASLWMFSTTDGSGVIALTGTFDLGLIKTRFAEKPAVEIVEMEGVELAFSFRDHKKNEPRLGVFLDSTTMLAGEPALVERFLAGRRGEVDVHDTNQAKLGALREETSALAATVFSIPDEWRRSQKMPLVQMIMPMVGDAYLTADLETDIGFMLRLTPKEPTFQEPLEQMLTSMIQLGLQQQRQALEKNPQNPGARMVIGVLEKMQVTRTTEGDVTLAMSITPDDLGAVHGDAGTPAEAPAAE